MILTAHTPVIREERNDRVGHIRLYSDPSGPDHGLLRPATVAAIAEIGGETIRESRAVMMVPGTDLEEVFLELHDSREGWAAEYGLSRSLFLEEGGVEEATVEFLAGHGGSTSLSSAMQLETLAFLDFLRSFPEEAALVDGYDWAPIVTGEGYRAVAFYPRGKQWNDGYVLDPLWSAEKQAFTWAEWPPARAGAAATVDPDPAYRDLYPATSGGRYPDTYPPIASLRSWGEIAPAESITVVTMSPVTPLLTDGEGRRSGVLPDGTVVDEIPGTFLMRVELPGEEPKYCLEAEAPSAELTLTGTAGGTFDAVVLRRSGADGRLGADWRGVTISEGEVLTATLPEGSVFTPLRRGDGTEIWPRGSAGLDLKKLKLKVKKPGRDSISVKGRWYNGPPGIDTSANDLVVTVGDRVFTVPAGAARVSKKGKVSYKGSLPTGGLVKFAYSPAKNTFVLTVKKLDLTGFGAPVIRVECRCGDRRAGRRVRLVKRGKGFVSAQ